MTTKNELKTALIAERHALIELVETLSDEQLDAASLCDGWSNRNVLSHILSFELNSTDAAQLFMRLKPLDNITAVQAKRYADCSRDQYLKLLRRGLKRTLRLLGLMPSAVIDRKFIRVPNGRLSLAQLVGDLVIDRAIHRLDIAHPLGMGSRIDDPEVMAVAVAFVLASIDLLNPKIPVKYYGQTVKLVLTGTAAATYYWAIGTGQVTLMPNQTTAVLKVTGDTNDLLFTIAVREALIGSALVVEGDHALEQIIRTSFNANALWSA